MQSPDTDDTDTDTDTWQSIGPIAKRLAARLIELRLAAAGDIGTALTPPPSNDNGVPGQVHKLTSTASVNPCSA